MMLVISRHWMKHIFICANILTSAKDHPSSVSFPKMTATARARSGSNQGPGTSSWSSKWVAGAHVLKPPFTSFSGVLAESWTRSEAAEAHLEL